MPVKKVAILGGGSFGTVIANIIAQNGYRAMLWMRDNEQAQTLNLTRENSVYLPGYAIDEKVEALDDLEKAVLDGEMVLVAVPGVSFRSVVKQVKPHLWPGAILVSLTKGIEPGTFALMSEILKEECPGHEVAVLSGPNLAREIAIGSPTGTVIASKNPEIRKKLQRVLRSEKFRVYANEDMKGVELGGSLKNIYAIIAGLADALGMGHNTNSMLVTRSLTEMARFGVRLGAEPMTFLGLSGVGDLIVTCSSPMSRNFRVGKALGEGKSVETIINELGQIAEGVNTLKQVKEKADSLGVDMPLAAGLYEIIYNNESVDHIIESLMLEENDLDVEFEVGRQHH
jgi:glycerol-3-phosphate dehydrogenase (NAD(P)+)